MNRVFTPISSHLHSPLNRRRVHAIQLPSVAFPAASAPRGINTAFLIFGNDLRGCYRLVHEWINGRGAAQPGKTTCVSYGGQTERLYQLQLTNIMNCLLVNQVDRYTSLTFASDGLRADWRSLLRSWIGLAGSGPQKLASWEIRIVFGLCKRNNP